MSTTQIMVIHIIDTLYRSVNWIHFLLLKKIKFSIDIKFITKLRSLYQSPVVLLGCVKIMASSNIYIEVTIENTLDGNWMEIWSLISPKNPLINIPSAANNEMYMFYQIISWWINLYQNETPVSKASDCFFLGFDMHIRQRRITVSL